MKVVIMWTEGNILTEKEFVSYKEDWIADNSVVETKADFLSQLDESDIEKLFSNEADINQLYSIYMERSFTINNYYTFVDITPGKHLYVDYEHEECYIGENTLPFEIYTFEEE